MKYSLYLFLLLFSFLGYSQEEEEILAKKDTVRKSLRQAPKEAPKAPHSWYKLYTLSKDTVSVDTSLTIKSDYKFNHLRKDNFGLLPFANDGHTYTTLHFGYTSFNALPDFGCKAKQFNYQKANEVIYYSVPTPLSELYFKTVLEQGQSVDALVTVNTSKNLNFSIAYKGLRSLGKYLNSLSSNGNFKFTTSYHTTNKRYSLNLHYVSQDFTNQENGSLLNLNNFLSGSSQFRDRSRLDVVLEDAITITKGRRYFIDHQFRINKNENANSIYVEHQMSYEKRDYTFDKPTATKYFGTAYITENYSDFTKSNSLYNRLGTTFYAKNIGRFNVFAEDIRYNYFYTRVVNTGLTQIPNTNNFSLQALGGKYFYRKGKIRGEALFSKAISKKTFSTLDIFAQFSINEKNSISAQYQNLSKQPDLNYVLYQSDFVNYNWYNTFENEKINNLKINAKTQWITAEAQFTLLNDYLYFSNNHPSDTLLLVTPKQYSKSIHYVSVKIEKEFKFRKFALDNTVLYQQVTQDDAVLNVPQLVTRNTLYFTSPVFKKAMLLQTGFTFQYFTKYYANDYNPLISEFYSQKTTKIGAFPLIDFFVNARVRQARIFLKAEHFNSSFSETNYFAAPNYPYKDFLVRFGIVWNFFQ